MASSLIHTETPRTQKAHHLRSLGWLSEAHGSGLGSPKAVAAKLRSSSMEHTGPLPPPSGSLGTGLHHCTHYLGEYGYPKKCYSLISSEAQPTKGKQQSASPEACPHLTPRPPSAQPHLHSTLTAQPTQSPRSYGSPLWVLLVLLVGPSCPVLGNYHDVGVVSFVFRLQAWQVCRGWHTPGCGNFPETL